MSWQIALVLLIEALAVVFLVRMLFGSSRPQAPKGPDVPADALIRKKAGGRPAQSDNPPGV